MRSLISELASSFTTNYLTNGEIRIYTDASDKGIRGALVEYHQGTDMSPLASTSKTFPQGKVIAFCSKRLSPAEIRYSITDRELLAVRGV
jgi:hypothetical protein